MAGSSKHQELIDLTTSDNDEGSVQEMAKRACTSSGVGVVTSRVAQPRHTHATNGNDMGVTQSRVASDAVGGGATLPTHEKVAARPAMAGTGSGASKRRASTGGPPNKLETMLPVSRSRKPPGVTTFARAPAASKAVLASKKRALELVPTQAWVQVHELGGSQPERVVWQRNHSATLASEEDMIEDPDSPPGTPARLLAPPLGPRQTYPASNDARTLRPAGGSSATAGAGPRTPLAPTSSAMGFLTVPAAMPQAQQVPVAALATASLASAGGGAGAALATGAAQDRDRRDIMDILYDDGMTWEESELQQSRRGAGPAPHTPLPGQGGAPSQPMPALASLHPTLPQGQGVVSPPPWQQHASPQLLAAMPLASSWPQAGPRRKPQVGLQVPGIVGPSGTQLLASPPRARARLPGAPPTASIAQAPPGRGLGGSTGGGGGGGSAAARMRAQVSSSFSWSSAGPPTAATTTAKATSMDEEEQQAGEGEEEGEEGQGMSAEAQLPHHTALWAALLAGLDKVGLVEGDQDKLARLRAGLDPGHVQEEGVAAARHAALWAAAQAVAAHFKGQRGIFSTPHEASAYDMAKLCVGIIILSYPPWWGVAATAQAVPTPGKGELPSPGGTHDCRPGRQGDLIPSIWKYILITMCLKLRPGSEAPALKGRVSGSNAAQRDESVRDAPCFLHCNFNAFNDMSQRAAWCGQGEYTTAPGEQAGRESWKLTAPHVLTEGTYFLWFNGSDAAEELDKVANAKKQRAGRHPGMRLLRVTGAVLPVIFKYMEERGLPFDADLPLGLTKGGIYIAFSDELSHAVLVLSACHVCGTFKKRKEDVASGAAPRDIPFVPVGALVAWAALALAGNSLLPALANLPTVSTGRPGKKMVPFEPPRYVEDEDGLVVLGDDGTPLQYLLPADVKGAMTVRSPKLVAVRDALEATGSHGRHDTRRTTGIPNSSAAARGKQSQEQYDAGGYNNLVKEDPAAAGRSGGRASKVNEDPLHFVSRDTNGARTHAGLNGLYVLTRLRKPGGGLVPFGRGSGLMAAQDLVSMVDAVCRYRGLSIVCAPSDALLTTDTLWDLGIYLAQGRAACLPAMQQPPVVQQMTEEQRLHRSMDYRAAKAALLSDPPVQPLVTEAYMAALREWGLS